MIPSLFLLVPIIFPVIFGFCVLLFQFKKKARMQSYVFTVVILNTIFTLVCIFFPPTQQLKLVSFGNALDVVLFPDGLSKVFATLVAILWPLTTLYSFTYMEHEGNERKFYAYFTATFGVVVGIAFAKTLVALYLFYELLTLITLPLVMHSNDDKCRYAGKKYLLYSMFGASLVFIGLIILYLFSDTMSFKYGGFFESIAAPDRVYIIIAFLLLFCGFGVKAAVFPFHGWLPSASVAPTPVSALLHAVAVVKSGVFAIIRTIYYCIGPSILLGTWGQWVCQIMVIATIIYGSTKALRTQHLKRRLAYSTVSQLSYILLGVTLMTPLGFAAGLMHLVSHAIMKITLFFCAGSILVATGEEYVFHLEGYIKIMPVTMTTFSIAGLSLVGVPPLAGFVSKFYLGTAAAQTNTVLGYLGIGSLVISALLTCLYICAVIRRACFPIIPERMYENKEVPFIMWLPMMVIGISCVLFGLLPGGLYHFFTQIAFGII